MDNAPTESIIDTPAAEQVTVEIIAPASAASSAVVHQLESISEDDFYNLIGQEEEGICLLQAHVETCVAHINAPIVHRGYDMKYDNYYVAKRLDAYDACQGLKKRAYEEEMRQYRLEKEKYDAEMYAIEMAKYKKDKEAYDAAIQLQYLQDQKDYEEKMQRYYEDKALYDADV